jgi:uncharacterized membrane protein YbhN (UPF0104 family)
VTSPATPTRSRSPSPEGSAARPRLDVGAALRRAALIVAVLVLVFGVLLPRFVDYEAVIAALAALTPEQLGLLGIATLGAFVASAAPSRALVRGLSWPQAVGSDLAARAVATTIPGPSDVATRFTLYRQWSIPTDVAVAGTTLLAIVEPLSAFALPVIAAGAMLVAGRTPDTESVRLAVVGLAVLAAVAAVLGMVTGSERVARRLGDGLQALAIRLWGVVRKPAPTGIAEGILDLRERAGALLTERGALGFAAAVSGRLAWFVVFEVALWCVGVGPDVLPPSTVLATMGIVAVISLLPTTPGAVGVAEVAYIGLLSSVAGPEMTEQITAAVSLFRIAQWATPIPVGWVLLLVMRRGHGGALLEGSTSPGQPDTADAAVHGVAR